MSEDRIHITCPYNEHKINTSPRRVRIHLEVNKEPRGITDSFIFIRCPECSIWLQSKTGLDTELLRSLREMGAKYLTSKKMKEIISFFVGMEDGVAVDSYKEEADKHKIEITIDIKPPLTNDDVIDMHFKMKGINNVEDFLRATGDDKKDL